MAGGLNTLIKKEVETNKNNINAGTYDPFNV